MLREVTWDTKPIGDTTDPVGFGALGELYFLDMRVNYYSPKTIVSKREMLSRFVRWCDKQSIYRPTEVTQEVIYAYKKHLHFYRTAKKRALSIYSQRLRLTVVKVFFEWLLKHKHITVLPVDDLELPRLPHQLPRHILSVKEVERLLTMPDLTKPTGLRNRAIMELLYSTAIRRAELCSLHLYDVDFERELIMVRQGKGSRDRIIPIGRRALGWISKYLSSARESLARDAMNQHLFVTYHGHPIRPTTLTSIMRSYVNDSGLRKQGSVHLMRHTTATLMLDNGADIRHIQSLLGHSSLTNTQIYTHVSVNKLKEVHEKTHPASQSVGSHKDQL